MIPSPLVSTQPAMPAVKCIFTYKNFALNKGISHIGLGVAAVNNAKMLRAIGVRAEVKALNSQIHLRQVLNLAKSAGDPYTHVVISAPWIQTDKLAQCAQMFPETQFAVNCHSNVAFLSVDPNAVALMRQGMALERETHNFHVAGNSWAFCQWMQRAYDGPCMYLPNMYYLSGGERVSRPLWRDTGGTLRFGMFGATRILKNFPGGAAAAIQVGRELGVPIEIWVNSKREDGPASTLNTVRQMVDGLPGVTLNYAPWAPWAAFRTTVAHMHACISPSFTESFNMVSADAISVGVPSAVSYAIDWVPKSWQCDADDTEMIARALVNVLHDGDAPQKGIKALQWHNHKGIEAWLGFLLGRDVVFVRGTGVG